MKHGHGKAIVSSNPKLRGWRTTVANAAKHAALQSRRVPVFYEEKRRGQANKRLVYFDEPVVVIAQFYFARPKRMRKDWGNYHGTHPDLDKLQRAIGDALEEASIVSNDSRICAWPAFPGKQYGAPRVEIQVESVAEMLRRTDDDDRIQMSVHDKVGIR